MLPSSNFNTSLLNMNIPQDTSQPNVNSSIASREAQCYLTEEMYSDYQGSEIKIYYCYLLSYYGTIFQKEKERKVLLWKYLITYFKIILLTTK